MQIAEASLKLNLKIFLADVKVKNCKCVVKVKLYHQACSAAGLEMSFLRPQRVFTYAYCCCIKSRFLKSRGFDGDAAYSDVGCCKEFYVLQLLASCLLTCKFLKTAKEIWGMAFAYSTFWICEMDFERVLLFKDPLTILYDPGIAASQTGLTCPLFSHAFLHITMRHLSRFHKRTIMVRNLKRSQLNWSIAKNADLSVWESDACLL